jgi:hypothetical protein
MLGCRSSPLTDSIAGDQPWRASMHTLIRATALTSAAVARAKGM